MISFSLLARILHFSGTHPEFTFQVLARIPHFRYSPGSYLFQYSPGFYLPGTCSDLTFLVLALILNFSGTHPDAITFSILTRIRSLFRYLPGFDLFFSVLARIRSLSLYLIEFDHSFSTCLDPFSVLTRIDPLCFIFSGTCLNSIPFASGALVLAQIRSFLFWVLRYSLGSIPYCFRGSPTSRSNPLVLLFQVSDIVSGFSYTTAGIVPEYSFSLWHCV